jgi:hypothetical protein
MPRGSKQINHLFAIFCRVNGFRLASSATDDGGFALDYYHGYTIVRLSSTGGQYEPFGSRRYSVKEFAAVLSFGIDLARMREERQQPRFPGRPASQYILGNPGEMTLDAWSKKYNVRVHHSETGYKCRVFERDIPNASAKRELYHLSDFVVSAAISGPAFALSPRKARTNPHHPTDRGSKARPGATYHVEVWEERDRCHIALWQRWKGNDTILTDWWDDDARQMFEDGFFKRGRQLKESVIEYAKEMGII